MFKNICHNCTNHQKCMYYRYNGVLPPKAIKFTKENEIYYIEQCNGFLIRQGFKNIDCTIHY